MQALWKFCYDDSNDKTHKSSELILWSSSDVHSSVFALNYLQIANEFHDIASWIIDGVQDIRFERRVVTEDTQDTSLKRKRDRFWIEKKSYDDAKEY